MRSLIQSSNAEAYKSLAQAIADAAVPEYSKITCPLLCVAGQEDQVARLEDLALIGDRHVPSSKFSPFFPCMQHACMHCAALQLRQADPASGSISEWSVLVGVRFWLTVHSHINRWGAPSKTELEVLFGVGHWHCIEDSEGMEGCLRRFAKKVERKLPQF